MTSIIFTKDKYNKRNAMPTSTPNRFTEQEIIDYHFTAREMIVPPGVGATNAILG